MKSASDLVALLTQLDTLLERNPGMLERLEREHRSNGQGGCSGCRQYDRPVPQWPCSIARAARLIRRNRAESSSGAAEPGL